MGEQPRGWLLWHRLGLGKPVDLETWRIWFCRVLVILGVVLFPLGCAFTIPQLIADGQYILIAIDSLVWAVLLIRSFSRSDSYVVNAFIILALLYVEIISSFWALGPTHARPVWLVTCAVMSALMFGVRGAVATTAANVVILLVLYAVHDPGNRAWAVEYQSSWYRWLVFVVNSTLLTIISSLPVGYMLGRLDESLKDERETQQKLSKEGARLKRTNESLAREIELRRNTEKTLREKEAYQRILFEKAPDGYYLIDQKGRTVNINQAKEKMLGYRKEELIGKRFYETGIFPADGIPEVIRLFETQLQGEMKGPVELEMLRKDGDSIIVEVNAFPVMIQGRIHLLGNSRDVTSRKQAERERHQMERRFMQAQKMEALGTLAGGVAHDFNNILSAVIGYSELALTDAGKGTMLENQLSEVLKAGTRARDLVRQILAFSRRESDHESRPIKVSTVAKDVLMLIRATLPATIDIRKHLESKAFIFTEPVQLHQVLMNLCTNSNQAMMERGGVLEVRVTDVMADAALCDKYPEMKPGLHVAIEVADTGTGIPPKLIEKIFDPYFTTKAPGEGSGLGLSIVHGIVKSCNGVLNVQSEPDRGTTIQIYLPAVEVDPLVKSEPDMSLPTGTERILLVDDESVVAEVGKMQLEKLGYLVDARTSSIESIDLFANDPGKYDLVMTDMTMPGITGKELAEKMMEIRADIPIVLCSGFSHQIDKDEAKQMGIKAFVMKPLKLKEIAHTIREVLDEASSGKALSKLAN